MILLGVLVAGAVGAPARYLVERAVHRAHHVFPWGTFVVNMSGSFAIGLVTGAALVQGFPTAGRTILGTGFLGAYTTFSTYAYEIVRRGDDGHAAVAARYAITSLVVGSLFAAAGLAVVGAL